MPSLLSRLGRFSGRHRLMVVVSWLLILLVAGVIAVTGMRMSDGTFDVPGTDSSRAMDALEEEFPHADEDAGGTLQLVAEVKTGEITAPDSVEAIAAARAEIETQAFVQSVTDPFDMTSPYISADLSTAVVTVTFDKLDEADSEAAQHVVEDVAKELRADGFTVEVGGSLAGGVPEILGPSEIVGALVAFLVLLLTFGSLIAAGANMLVALIGVGVGVLGTFAFSALVPVGSLTPILAVMLGLAVGIDYGLFILSRFRTELQEGRSVDEAIGRATGTAGSSVLFAGATVIIALVGLTVVGIPFLGEMGLAAAFSVFIAVLMSLTLLPALMSWMGRRALARRDRRRRATPADSQQPSSFTSRWGRMVVRRPVIAVLASVIGLSVVALPVVSMQTSLSVPGGEDPESTQRAAYELVADKFGDGAQDPLVVLVQGPRAGDDLERVQEELTDLENVEMVVPSGVTEDGRTAMLAVIATSGPLDEQTKQLVRDIRALDIPDITLAVTGGTAIGLDSDEQLQTALITYLVLIVGLSLILLVIMFRSILVPLVATVGFLLSLGAGLGATTAVFQWGWLGPLVQAPQGNPLLSLLPIVVTGILFGLAMDYQVFLVSRMQEAHHRGLSPKDAIRAGFDRSAVVVLAAAGIMTAVFGGFALSPSSLVGAIALGLTVGVIADAFVVRMIFVPAVLSLLGRAAWWVPAWLDRLLPKVDVEGAALDELGTNGGGAVLAPAMKGSR